MLHVELNRKALELVTREKYLGFFVIDSFYDDEYMKNEIVNTYARGNTIVRHFKHCSAVQRLSYTTRIVAVYIVVLLYLSIIKLF